MTILSDIQELIWMSFVPSVELCIYKLSANSVNPSTFAVSGSTIKYWPELLRTFGFSIGKCLDLTNRYQAELPGSLKLYQLIRVNQVQT